MKRIVVFSVAALLVILAGCIIRTEHRIDAHVTLDIRHIEQQAETVIDYMEGRTDQLPELSPVPGAEGTSMLERAWAWLDPMPTAHAQEDELKTESVRYRQILRSIHDRAGTVNGLKQSRCVGESNRGYLVVRDCAEAADPDRKREIEQVVADENEDREAFYNEIVRLNRDNAKITVSYVERLYAFTRLQNARPGQVFQLPPRAPEAPAPYDFEAFRELPLCDRLGDACRPGNWVTIP